MTTVQAFQDLGATGAAPGNRQVLTFILAGEEYGVDILQVQEIKGWQEATPLPNTPSHVRGVINMRGTIVPIVDLRERFSLEPQTYGPTTVNIVLRVSGDDGRERVVGIVVDAVSDVYALAPDQIQPPPDFGTSVAVDSIAGLATVDDKMLILLDASRLLDTGELDHIERGAPDARPPEPTSV